MELSALAINISEVFLYFIFYSFVGWCMETVYCSVLQRKWVARGFLFGPICPIYGVGALLLAAGGHLFSDHPLVLYLVATVVLSAWEYLVGWLLEVTTKMKYWDYSHHKYNLHGRISLWISMWWGVLAFLMVYFVHPAVTALFAGISLRAKLVATIVLLLTLLVDAAFTIRALALTRRLMVKLEEISEQLKERIEELPAPRETLSTARENLSEAADSLREKLEELPSVRESWSHAVRSLKERYDSNLEALEKHSRRFRKRYQEYSSARFADILADVKDRVRQVKDKFNK